MFFLISYCRCVQLYADEIPNEFRIEYNMQITEQMVG